MNKQLTCIVCPVGCSLVIDESGNVSGNHCKRGLEFAKSETTNPTRVITTTIAIEGAIHRRLPVVSSQPVPKSKMMEFVKATQAIKVFAPVNCGDVLLEDVLGLGIDVMASRTLGRKEDVE